LARRVLLFSSATRWRDAGQRSSIVPVSKEISPVRSSLMNHSVALGGRSRPAPCWALTQADVLLCALPIAVFLSIVSLV